MAMPASLGPNPTLTCTIGNMGYRGSTVAIWQIRWKGVVLCCAVWPCIFLPSPWPHVPDHACGAAHEEIIIDDEGDDGAVCALCCLERPSFRVQLLYPVFVQTVSIPTHVGMNHLWHTAE